MQTTKTTITKDNKNSKNKGVPLGKGRNKDRVVTTKVVQSNAVKNRRKIRKNIINKPGKSVYKSSNYRDSLFYPELMTGVENFIPRYFLGASNVFGLHLTYTVTTNASGNFCGVYDPYILLDDSTSPSASLLFLNTNTSYTGADPGNFTNLVATSIGLYSTPLNSTAAYRLVSACVYLVAEQSILNKQGKFIGAVAPLGQQSPVNVTTPYAAYNVPTAIQAVSTIQSLTNAAESAINTDTSLLRLVWYPANLNDYDYFLINQDDGDIFNSAPDISTQFVFAGTNLGANAKVNLEFYLNYEVVPQVKSQQFRFATCRMAPEDPIGAKMQLLSNVENLARPVQAQYCVHDMKGHKTGFSYNPIKTSLGKFDNMLESNMKKFSPDEFFNINLSLESGKGFHLPGYNYMGPFTSVEANINEGIRPINHNDTVAMFHDIDYLEASGPLDVYLADLKAFRNFDYSPSGLIGKAGMAAKMLTPITSFFLTSNDPLKAKTLRAKAGKLSRFDNL